jgi:hypothetical protein
MPYCKACNAELIWVKMQSGRVMPCNATPQKFILINNEKKIGCLVEGYIPHWATCPKAKNFKHKRKE